MPVQERRFVMDGAFPLALLLEASALTRWRIEEM